MPAIGNNTQTFLQGLSDFWTRFYEDTDELDAMYRGTELLLGQVYLDMVASFLAVSLNEAPIFNRELFKPVVLREDALNFNWALNAANDRYTAALPGTMVSGAVLQNKIFHPTVALDLNTDYEINADDGTYTFLFHEDIVGRANRVLGSTSVGTIPAIAAGPYTKLYVVNSETPFATAKAGDWVRVTNCAVSSNNRTYKIIGVVNSQGVLLTPAFTLPEASSGVLVVTVMDSEFMALPGLPVRRLTVSYPSSFDDATERALTEQASWYADRPTGMGVRKGDILYIRSLREYDVVLVRHNKLLFNDTVVAATGLPYTVLRVPEDTEVEVEPFTCAETITGTLPLRTTATGSLAIVAGFYQLSCGVWSTPVVADDQQRYVTISGAGLITWQASVSTSGVLTWVAGAITNPLVRALATCRVTITGSVANDGTYTATVMTTTSVQLPSGTYIAEASVNVELLGITNDGTYKVKGVNVVAQTLTLDLPIANVEPHNGNLTCRLHDGFRATLAHTWLQPGSFVMYAGVGDANHGGRRAVNSTDYTLYLETGTILQTGRMNGLWGMNPWSLLHADYNWRYALMPVALTGALSATASEVVINEISLWAPDASVDKYHLYNNFGYLINRFSPSSEAYRSFIRGVFQLYIMGPALARIEAALNVISGYAVIRDNGEILESLDTSDALINVVHTLRLTGEVGVYEYPKAVPLRADITSYTLTSIPIIFEAFDALTTLFTVTDTIEDPTWWESIVIPSKLLPSESVDRRTTFPVLYENVVGAADNSLVGDMGLFIGADDEGVIPSYGPTAPAKRRKLANVIMNLFLKHHMFYVHFDVAVYTLLPLTFVTDLQEIILVAKPSHKYVYIEPSSSFVDIMILADVFAGALHGSFADPILFGGDLLTIQSSSWNIGDVWRRNAPGNSTFTTSNGINVPPAGVALPIADDEIIAARIGVPDVDAPIREGINYTFDRKLGEITPLNAPGGGGQTLWPAGPYTVDYSHLQLTAQAGKNIALGDTDYVIGGQDPSKVYVHQMGLSTGEVRALGADKFFTDPNMIFVPGIHGGVEHYILIKSGAPAGLHRIRFVKDSNSVFLEDPNVPIAAGLYWSFRTDEPRDGRLYSSGGKWYLESRSAIFLQQFVDRWIDIKDATNPADVTIWRIAAVPNRYTVELDGVLHPDTGVHWQLTGSSATMDVIERPLELTFTPFP